MFAAKATVILIARRLHYQGVWAVQRAVLDKVSSLR